MSPLDPKPGELYHDWLQRLYWDAERQHQRAAAQYINRMHPVRAGRYDAWCGALLVSVIILLGVLS